MLGNAYIQQIFAGGLENLEPEGQRTGIYKRGNPGAARVEVMGIVGDEHGDPRVHGGAEKAVHQYAVENYSKLMHEFPQCAQSLKPGSLGENISAHGMSEPNVHIGDVFQAGSAVLQVSQPRSPCWKINHRFGVERMSMFIAQARITGWYYRVLRPGNIQPGDPITRLERHTSRFSIEQFWLVQMSHRPSLDDLAELAAVPGLAPEWRQRLQHRAKWLRAESLGQA
ncbi:MOSC domain-containing protein YiiM [Paraburkholderia terricola]|uniref:MOSC domain-containing protein YiiM n=1 Tax=Paraburkholderia terricola TaxID=169427 RepID=A0ABU1M1A2_9BURK|nr:MOSC domain-containing protein [Paraburkholderia terricola]MDR6412794.1 MOSC domain-containing protein YiiM [Paraburkholderia terricola]MDR6495961.1 MOSC domain-containing protein YiiM [Paraburkholderia terricola]